MQRQDKSLTAKSRDVIVGYLSGGYRVKYMKFEAGKYFLMSANKNKNTQQSK